MSYVELGSKGFYQHVIYVHLHGCSYLLLEHPVHQPLIGGSCVLDPKWHHTITIGSLRCDERGLFLVFWVHADLVVAGEGIHKTEEFMAGSGIHDEVDSRQRENVFLGLLINLLLILLLGLGGSACAHLNPISCPPALSYSKRGQGLYRFLDRMRLPCGCSGLV